MRELSLKVRIRFFLLPLVLSVLIGIATIVYSIHCADPHAMEYVIIVAQTMGMKTYVTTLPIAVLLAEEYRGKRALGRLCLLAVAVPLLNHKLPIILVEILGSMSRVIALLVIVFIVSLIYATKHFFPEHCEP